MSTTIYNETLSIFLNILKTSPTQRRSLFNGLLTVGTNAYSFAETQLLPGGTFSGAPSLNALVISCDQTLSITLNNGLTTFTTTIQSLLVIPGVISSWTITNISTNPANCVILSA